MIQHYTLTKCYHYIYKKGGVVIAKMDESPTFGDSLDIICVNELILLFLELYTVKNFDDHYHAFAVERTQSK